MATDTTMTPSTDPARDEAVRAFWETPREISHQEADEAAIRLINSHFKNDAERARVSIPANPERDDDLIIRSYIRQQMRRAKPPASGVDAVVEAMENDPFWQDAPLAGTTQQDQRIRHYAEVAVASLSPAATSGSEAGGEA